QMGLRVVYYISPQIWAWRRGRVKHIAKYVDHMIVIFPFEEDFYREHRVPVTYVGHPLIDELSVPLPLAGEGGAQRRVRVLRVALLPGSRRMEVNALLPPMLEAVSILKRERDIDAFIIRAPTIDLSPIDGVRIVPHDRGEALSSADIALSSSGTATLECAIVGTPVVVMYRLSPMTYQLAKWLVKLPHFSLVNIVAGRRIVPELLQHDVTGEKIAAAVREVLASYDRVRDDLAAVKAKLGEKGASRRAAEAIMSVVRG
ncbi:MAG TPA: lipid-A-disaccharide synthase, partial [Thermoanaerobaculia bacterium]